MSHAQAAKRRASIYGELERMKGEIWQLRQEVDHWKARAHQNVAALSERNADQIRDEAVQRFNAVAAKKYDKGQKEHGGNLDEHPSLIVAIEEEIIDAWMYTQSAARQLESKDREIARLNKKLEVSALSCCSNCGE